MIFNNIFLRSMTARTNRLTSLRGNKVSLDFAAFRLKSTQRVEEIISFPSSRNEVETPVLLNSREHAVGYLSKILNARCYDAAIETQLQEAKSLSMVSFYFYFASKKDQFQ